MSLYPAKHFKQLPAELDNIYQEVVSAFNLEMNRLCALGMRSLIECICKDKGIKGNNLYEKIRNMINIPLSLNIVENLGELRLMGNEAAHDLGVSEKDELTLAIQICEDLLNSIYELDYRASLFNELRAKKKHMSINPQVSETGKIIPFKKPSEDPDLEPNG